MIRDYPPKQTVSVLHRALRRQCRSPILMLSRTLCTRSLRQPLETVAATLRTDMTGMFEEIHKPERFHSTTLDDFFQLQFVALASKVRARSARRGCSPVPAGAHGQSDVRPHEAINPHAFDRAGFLRRGFSAPSGTAAPAVRRCLPWLHSPNCILRRRSCPLHGGRFLDYSAPDALIPLSRSARVPGTLPRVTAPMLRAPPDLVSKGDGLAQFSSDIWGAIQSKEELNVPSHKQLLAVFQCVCLRRGASCVAAELCAPPNRSCNRVADLVEKGAQPALTALRKRVAAAVESCACPALR